MADELKPCPDGHKDVYLWESKRAHDGAPQWDVVCGGQDCEWALWGFLDRDSVVRQWNARAAAPADASLIDRLHTAEAKVEVLSVELRALNQVNAENIKLRQMLATQQDEIERLRAQAAAVPFEDIVACAWDSINGDCGTGSYPASVLNWVDRQPHGTNTKEAHA